MQKFRSIVASMKLVIRTLLLALKRILALPILYMNKDHKETSFPQNLIYIENTVKCFVWKIAKFRPQEIMLPKILES